MAIISVRYEILKFGFLGASQVGVVIAPCGTMGYRPHQRCIRVPCLLLEPLLILGPVGVVDRNSPILVGIPEQLLLEVCYGLDLLLIVLLNQSLNAFHLFEFLLVHLGLIFQQFVSLEGLLQLSLEVRDVTRLVLVQLDHQLEVVVLMVLDRLLQPTHL